MMGVEGGGSEKAPYQSFPCNFHNVGIMTKNFLTFSFNLFATLL